MFCRALCARRVRLAVCVSLLGLAGCATLGPTSLPGDRFNYNKSLARSSNEQLLLNIVRQRYGEPLHWLEVSSMLSQYSLQADASAGAWWNDLDVWSSPALRAVYDVDGDPSGQESWHAGVSFSDRPTISYAPVQGEDFARRLLSPIPVSAVLFFVQAGWPVDEVFQSCVARMNGLQSSSSTSPTAPESSDQSVAFENALECLRAAQDAGRLQGSMEQDPVSGDLFLVMEPVESQAEYLQRLRDLLGIARDAQRVRVTPRGRNRAQDELAIQTRSLLGTLQALARSVDVPNEHLERGTTLEWTAPTGAQESLCVRHSAVPRLDAFVQIRHKGYWFYIAESDARSKRTFALLTYLYSLQSGDLSGKGPLLTVPASR